MSSTSSVWAFSDVHRRLDRPLVSDTAYEHAASPCHMQSPAVRGTQVHMLRATLPASCKFSEATAMRGGATIRSEMADHPGHGFVELPPRSTTRQKRRSERALRQHFN